jgi:hypothetical protein
MSRAFSATAGISGPNLPDIRRAPNGKRFSFTPMVKVPGDVDGKRNFFAQGFKGGSDDSNFTLTGELAGELVVVSVRNYRSSGPDSRGDATVELASEVAARPAPLHVVETASADVGAK